MKSSDQADSGGDWRVQLQDMRTISAMRAGSPHPDEVERLSDRALRAAALNPDHSDEARAAAAEALRARRLSTEPWRLRVPSFLGAKDLEKGDRGFRDAWWNAVLWSAVLAVTLLVAAIALTAFEGARNEAGLAAIEREMDGCLQSGACTRENVAAELAGADGGAVHLPAVVLAALGFLAAIAWLVLLVIRTKPARIGVLRAADTIPSREALRRAISTELRRYGHVITLSTGAEGVLIKSAADYRARALEMGNRIGLNLTNMGTRRETLALSATDQWRPLVLNLVLDSSDAIVVDLSDGGSWALAAIQAEGAASRCVFVALWGRLEEAEAALRTAGLSQRVFPYAPDGEMQRRPQFRAAMLEAMRATHAADA